MAAIPGSVRVAGFIAPTDSTDTFAVTDEIYNRGGYRSVLTIEDRNNITADRRKIGMLVYVIGNDEYYTLKTGILNTDWVKWSVASSGTTLSDLDDVLIVGPTQNSTLTYDLASGTWQSSRTGTGLTNIPARTVLYGNGTNLIGYTSESTVNGSFLREDATGNPYWSNVIDGGEY